MNKTYAAAIDVGLLATPPARGIARAMWALMMSVRQRYTDRVVARTLTELDHPGVLADFQMARDGR